MIIGLMGFIGSGKDTIGIKLEYLLSKRGSVEKYAFADPLKEQCALLVGVKASKFSNRMFKNKYAIRKDDFKLGLKKDFKKNESFTIRQFMQYYGTDIMQKAFGQDIWINKTFNKINESEADNIIITDVRFKTEFNKIKENGGIIVNVINPEIHNEDKHISELDLVDVKPDYVIINDWQNNRSNPDKEVFNFISKVYGSTNKNGK